MNKIVSWITKKYLPAYAVEKYLEENARLFKENAALRQLLEQERAYSRGLEYALRRKVVINTK